jgi:hypothetical protein
MVADIGGNDIGRQFDKQAGAGGAKGCFRHILLLSDNRKTDGPIHRPAFNSGKASFQPGLWRNIAYARTNF